MRPPAVKRSECRALFFVFLASCSVLKKPDSDAGPTITVIDNTVDAAPVPAPPLLAANQGDIARFPDETPIIGTNTAQRTFAVREAPPSGAIVGQLVKGTVVTQLSSRGPYVLVVYEKSPGTQTMGWVHRDVFSASIADAGALTCASGESPIFTDVPACGKTCVTDTECGSGQACKGNANKLTAANKAGDAVKVCTASGGTIDAGMTKDAGAVNAPVQDVVNSPGAGKCPASYLFLAKTGKCHRPCPGGPSGKECKNQPFFCIKCNADFVCLETANQCK